MDNIAESLRRKNKEEKNEGVVYSFDLEPFDDIEGTATVYGKQFHWSLYVRPYLESAKVLC